MKLRWTPKARQDRQEQLEFVAEDQPAAAVRLAEEILSQTRLLMAHPEMGRLGKVPGTRELVVARTPFIAVYRLQADHIEIIRLMHGAQSWPPAI